MAITDITNADIGGIVGQVFFWLIMILFITVLTAVLGFMAWTLWKMLKYKVSVDIYEHVGENTHVGRRDVGREVEETTDGKRKRFLQLLKLRKKIGPFASDKFMQFGNRKKLDLHLENGIFTPLPVAHNSDPALQFNKTDLLAALQSWDQDYAENLETHRITDMSFFSRHEAAILSGTMIIMMFVLFFILINQMQSGVNVTATIDTSQLVKAG